MTQKAYRKGSTCPPLSAGTLRLYSMRTCPYAQRTRLVLAHYGIPHEVVNCALQVTVKPEWLFEKNPLGLVPVLEKDGKIVYESPICNEYLDEIYGNSRLHSKDPYEKAKKKMLMERFSKVSSNFYPLVISSSTEETKKKAYEELNKALQTFENLLPGKYFGVDDPDAVDFHFWPFFERFGLVHEIAGIDLLPADRFPKLTAWVETMKALPAVQATYFDTKVHVDFLKGYANGGVPDYDHGLEP